MRSTFRPEVIGDIGGFGGLFALRPAALPRPAARVVDRRRRHEVADRPGRPAASTRSASTSSRCASTTSPCQGAEPLFFLDYIAVGKLDPDQIDAARRRASPRAAGRPAARCIGGEMAEHPGAMEPGEFDLVGFAVGVVERDRRAHRRDVRAGRRARRPAVARACAATATRWPARVLLERGRPLARRARPGRARTTRSPTSCSRPSRDLRAGDARRCAERSTCTASRTSPAAASPATSPGCCPADCDAVRRPRRVGGAADLRRDPARSATSPTTRWRTVFNLGIGMVVAVAPATPTTCARALRGHGHEARRVGEVVDGSGQLTLVP